MESHGKVPDLACRHSALFPPSVLSSSIGSQKTGNYISQPPLPVGFPLGPAKEMEGGRRSGALALLVQAGPCGPQKCRACLQQNRREKDPTTYSELVVCPAEADSSGNIRIVEVCSGSWDILLLQSSKLVLFLINLL